ncbi:hypothetical protein GCM10022239_03390 [Leifsonia bigeumensis]|uniref:HK97 gp10 family phage protein n=1 Tax=Leifsonella bigeumensis TaxID=433643 RepID=A0ABP7F7U7_9MICO
MGVQANVTVESNVFQVLNDAEGRLMRGENKAAERLLALSSAEVPFEFGTLDESGAVLPAENAEDGAAVTYDTPYAARLHEHPEYDFQNGRKGKYLEDPAIHNRAELGQILGAEVRRG